MQQAVFLFTQIFFVILTLSVFGIVIFTVIKNRGKNNNDSKSNENIPTNGTVKLTNSGVENHFY